MLIATVCIALLGLLVFGLGFGVSAMRGSTGRNWGYDPVPTDTFYKLNRAHGNAAEYAPMLAVLMYVIAVRGASTWMIWTFIAATVFRYLHAAGMILSPTLDRPNPLRFAGALGTYVTGILLVLAALVV